MVSLYVWARDPSARKDGYPAPRVPNGLSERTATPPVRSYGPLPLQQHRAQGVHVTREDDALHASAAGALHVALEVVHEEAGLGT